MQRIVYILFSLLISLAVYATKVDLQPSSSTWHTAMPNDTLYISQKGSYRVKISQIGKYHIEQTINDTIDFKLHANNIKDEKVKNGLPSTDTLQVSLKNLKAKNIQSYNDYYALAFEKDTCNINLLFEGAILLVEINQGFIKPHIYVSGKSPHFNFNASKTNFIVNRISGEGLCNALIETNLSPNDTLVYQLGGLEFYPHMHLSYAIAHMIKNNYGYVSVKASKLTCGIRQAKTSELHLCDNSHIELNDYTFHNAVITAGGKIYIDNATLQTTNDFTFIESADTIFIDETTGNTTINATIGSKQKPLNETKYSRVVVNKASYIKEITAMTDVYDGNIDILCPSPQVKDTLTHADINVYGGKIGQITNVVHYGPTGSFLVNYKNRIINVYGGTIGGNNTYSNTAIHCGFYQWAGCTTKDLFLNDTINLYNGKISIPKNYHLINFTDNTVINIYHNKSNNKRTQFKYHPSNDKATGEYFNYIALISDNIVGDSIHWTIGDMRHLSGIKSVYITKPWPGNTRKPFRIVYKNSQQPNDSLVYGVSKDSTHYFGRLLDTYDVVDIYPSFKRRITYVHTLDETWTSKDTTYYEGFGKSSLPKVIYAGRTFKGWYTQPEGGIKVDSISHLQMGDITLYTQWGPGQDIIYSDFDHNRLCNTGAVEIKYGKDLNNLIESGIKPLEGHNTKAMHCNVIQNEGFAKTLLYLRNSYLDNQDIYKNAPRVYMDLRSTTGISMKHKGMSVRVNVDNCYYVIPQHEELTLVNIPWEQFTLSGNRRDLENVSEIRFQPIAEQGEYWIDDIIFTQGDIYPLESIKLDTVPNKYLYTKNPDLLDIPLPIKADSTQLYLYPKFTPSDATYQAINWSSKDPSIATVDDYGRVNGISHGQTYIYCQSVMHPEVKDSILVGVSQGGLTYQLHGVSISNQLPATYDYNTPQAIPAPQPINDFYTFHGWHTDSITGAVVDSASYHQFGNLKTHTLYAEFTREIPGAAITILQNRILAVQNPYHYDALKEARYAWQYNNNPLASQSNFVEVGRPIPTGVYNVNIHIDQEMPISLARTIDNSTINNDDTNTNFTLYPNPIKAGQLAYLIGKFDHILLFDLNGMPVETTILNDGIIKAPQETGMYILKIGVKDQTYTLKLIVI